jgi:thiamine transport system substrate-binding protein
MYLIPMPVARMAPALALAVATAIVTAGFGSPTPPQDPNPTSVTLLTHDSFALSPGVLAAFEQAQGVTLNVLKTGDAGSMVNQAILTAGDPLADVMYGVDSTFLSRALGAGIFEAYRSPALDGVPEGLHADGGDLVTPIDYGDVCLNTDLEAFAGGAPPAPTRLEDLTQPAYASMLAVENPATSSPGLAFLLATIDWFGEDAYYGWREYWRDLRANDVSVSAGWEDAYYGAFSGGAGEGDRPIVVSYASSPVAEVYYADPQPDQPPTGVVLDGCFRSVEYAAVLAGTRKGALARALVDYLLSQQVQEDIPLNMFVFPALSYAQLPDLFTRFAQVPAQPLTMDPARIEAGRDGWIEEWTQIVLR